MESIQESKSLETTGLTADKLTTLQCFQSFKKPKSQYDYYKSNNSC